MTRHLLISLLVTSSIAGVGVADDNVVRQPATAVQDDAKSADDVKKEAEQARKDAEAARQQAQEALKAAEQTKQDLEKAKAQVQAQRAADAANPAPAVANPNPIFTGISRMKVSSVRKDDRPGIDVTCSITLINVPNIPFTYEAVLVDGKGKVHTDAQGRPYSGSREVSTGDQEDTDRYTVWISCVNLFSSRPPADLYVQARLIDAAGRFVATSVPQAFQSPKE